MSKKETLVVRPGVLPGLYTLSPERAALASAPEPEIGFDASTLKHAGGAAISTGTILRGLDPFMTGGGSIGVESPSKRGKPYKGHTTESAFDERSIVFKGYFNESVADSAMEVRSFARARNG